MCFALQQMIYVRSCEVSISLDKFYSAIDITEMEKLVGSQSSVSHIPHCRVCVLLHWHLGIIH